MNTTTDQKLDKVLLNQLVWKNPSCTTVGIRILNRALSAPHFYPEDIDHSDLPKDDLNTVGSMFRFLGGKKASLIHRTANFKSADCDKAPKANGRTVFAYTLTDGKRAVAESLVKRLGGEPVKKQMELL